jgi:hypothetical protein
MGEEAGAKTGFQAINLLTLFVNLSKKNIFSKIVLK